MYTIIGGDGKEYGPVTAQQVQAWIAAGRANLDTQAKAEGTREWKRLGDFADFGGAAEPPLAGAAPPVTRRLAGRMARLGAVLVNGFLAALCLLPLMNPNFTSTSSRNAYSFAFADMINIKGNPHLLADSWPLLLLLLIQVGMLSTLGQTLGKRLFRIRIVRFHSSENPGFAHAFLLRWLLPEMIGMIPFFGWIFLCVNLCFIFREDRRCLHDLIADTVVVDARVSKF